MNSVELRSNMAGYLDGAATLINAVQNAIVAGGNIKTKAGPKINCPPAVLSELKDAVEKIDRCSEWLMSNINSGFEK